MNKITTYLKRKIKILVSKYFENLILIFETIKVKNIFNRNKGVILIYSIGKVGSSSIYNTLKNSNNNTYPVFHVHSLNLDRLKEQKEYYRSSKRGSVPFHLIQSTVISQCLNSYTGELFVINLTREPISREMSSIFQDSFNFSNSFSANDENLRKVVRENFEGMLSKIPEDDWYERELKSVFNIDIYDNDFELAKGYYVEKYDSFIFGFIRLENLNDVYSKFIKEILGTSNNEQLVISNQAEHKFYNQGYKSLINELFVTNEEFDCIARTRFFQKFYGDLEQKIRSKWVKE